MSSTSGRVDLRAYIKRRMSETGISGYQLCKLLGKPRSNFYAFLAGRTPYPLDDIERILYILDHPDQ